MCIESDTLDDVMNVLLGRLLAQEQVIRATRGSFKELLAVSFCLRKPRARLSRSEGKGKIFSALGEFLWYMSGDIKLDYIDYYVPERFRKESDDNINVRSGYGDRLFNFRGLNQIDNVISLLKTNRSTRRAVIQLYDAQDIAKKYKSIPCTCTLQFIIRDDCLHLITSMRSNDAYIGLPHDVFSFTMLQEIIARATDVEVGEYRHFAGSLHLYDCQFADAQAYLDEGFQSEIEMPQMPNGDQWHSVRTLEELAQTIREGKPVDLAATGLDEYWKDLVRLLQAYSASRRRDAAELKKLKAEMHSPVYGMFIEARLDKLSEPRSQRPARTR